nr:MAG TPA: hypothetical protein [Caudoviricetes sp.]
MWLIGSPSGRVRLIHSLKILMTVFGLFVCFALPWRYRLSQNQPPGCGTRQPIT